jgi:hypothetical protein
MALIRDRQATPIDSSFRTFPVAAETVIYTGSLVSLDSDGGARPAREEVTDVVVGTAIERVDNAQGAAGAKSVMVSRDTAYFNNSADADEVELINVESPVFAVDGETVALTDGSATRPRAGVVHFVDPVLGVAVRFEA